MFVGDGSGRQNWETEDRRRETEVGSNSEVIGQIWGVGSGLEDGIGRRKTGDGRRKQGFRFGGWRSDIGSGERTGRRKTGDGRPNAILL